MSKVIDGSCDTCKHWEQFRTFGVCKLTVTYGDLAKETDPGQNYNTAYVLSETGVGKAWLWTCQDFCCNRYEEDPEIIYG